MRYSSLRPSVLVAFVSACFLFAPVTTVYGQTDAAIPSSSEAATPTLAIHRLHNPIEFDGVVDPSEWSDVEPVEMTQQNPTFGAPLSRQTELRVAYDEKYVYVSAVCHEDVGITETSYRRDDWNPENDQIAIMLDSFNDFENGVIFVLYATGARIDAEMSNDGRQITDANTDWNTYWDGRVSRNEKGWMAEIRIPTSSLRFQPKADGTVDMGMILYRFVAGLQEMQIYPAIPPNWGFWSFAKPSKGERVSFAGLEPKRPIYISPYVIGGYARNTELNEAETAYEQRDESTYDVGLDAKLSLSSNLTLDLTANTDFAQIEADNQQVNLTRFSLFFPEKRQFFLERTSNFDFSFGDNDRIFYSRRIGIFDGNEVQLLGGGRLVGRIGGYDVGLLTMQSARESEVRSENFSVARLKKQVLNRNSFVGGIATTRIDEDGEYNVAFGVDALLNVATDDYLLLNVAQTVDSEDASDLSVADRSRFRLLWQRVREVGLGYGLGFSRAGNDYDPGIGFQARSDFSQASAKLSFGTRPPESSPISSQLFSAESDLFFRNGDGELETAVVEIEYTGETRTDHQFSGGLEYAFEDLIDGFDLSDDASILPGRYKYATGSVSYSTPSGRQLKIESSVDAGSFYDGTRVSVTVSPSWSVSPNMRLSGTYSYNRVEFADRSQQFVANVVQGRLDIAFNTKISFSSFFQYNGAADIVVGNLRFRYNPKEGNDFFLVINDGYNTNRPTTIPILPVNSGRTILAKYTRTFGR